MDLPVSSEPRIRIEYKLSDDKNFTNYNPVLMSEDNSLSFESLSPSPTSRRFLNESITLPSRRMLFNESFKSLHKVCHELGIENENSLKTALDIVQYCLAKNIKDFEISKTGDKEILLYRKKNSSFSNILIDEDSDVSYMFIGNLPGQGRSAYFPYEEGLDISKIVALF